MDKKDAELKDALSRLIDKLELAPKGGLQLAEYPLTAIAISKPVLIRHLVKYIKSLK